MKFKIVNNAVTVLNFNDSFVYNIATEIYKLGISVQVVSIQDAVSFLELLNDLSDGKSDFKHVVIYGPGPGKPTDYQFIESAIMPLLGKKNVLNMGICLGHQILWGLNGISVKPSRNPIHGQGIKITIPSWKDVFAAKFWGSQQVVQRYNSLVLDVEEDTENSSYMCFTDDECVAGVFPGGVTWQFHPESVGTSCPNIFFECIERFLKSGKE